MTWLKPDGAEMQDGDWAASRCLGVAFYVPPSGQAPADRVLVWINGTAEPIAAALPEVPAGLVGTRRHDSAAVAVRAGAEAGR